MANETPILTTHNAQSRIIASRDLIKHLRPLVAYRDQHLPPVGVQAAIKAFMKRRRSHGRENDIARVFADQKTRDRLVEQGWGPETELLTPKMFEATMRLAGIWDGWRSLVSPGGYFGTGLLPHVRRALGLRMGVTWADEDLRECPAYNRITGMPHPRLYDFQDEACAAWHAAGGRGVVNLPPRSGKTHIAIGLAMQVGLPALVVVPTRNLVSQTVKRFREWLPKDQVIGVTGGQPGVRKQRRMNNAMVWIATPPTAAGPKPKGDDRRERRPGMLGIESRLFLIIDEFHHAAADTWQDISLAARNAYYRLGLTGTHYRADGRDLVMHSVLSSCVYRRTVDDMIKLGRLVPARVAMLRVPRRAGDPNVVHFTGHDVYPNAVVNHISRNLVLISAAKALLAQGRRVLVLAKEIEHTRRLAASIPGSVQVDGLTPDETEQALAQLQAGAVRCVVGTSVIGEGVDVPAADALVYARGGRSPVQVVQDTYRPLTAAPGKRYAIIVDVADNHHGRLLESAAHRLGLYRAQSAFTVDVLDSGQLQSWLEAA